jgi:hypothetical protein
MANNKKVGAPPKTLESYLSAPTTKAISLTDYMNAPASAFLRYVCDAFDAFEHCRNKFTKKADGTYNKDSDDSLRHLAVAIVATTMGHFETYQKCLFAGLFERTRYFATFDPTRVSKELQNPTIDLTRFCAYRGVAAPVGLTVADALPSWHSAEAVNRHFSALGMKQNVFSNDDIAALSLLWQFRHSIVHTGGWLTLPDSQKVKQLHGRGEQAIAFKHTFVNALARRLHKLVKAVNSRLADGISPLLKTPVAPEVQADLDAFLFISSPKPVWLDAAQPADEAEDPAAETS